MNCAILKGPTPSVLFSSVTALGPQRQIPQLDLRARREIAFDATLLLLGEIIAGWLAMVLLIVILIRTGENQCLYENGVNEHDVRQFDTVIALLRGSQSSRQKTGDLRYGKGMYVTSKKPTVFLPIVVAHTAPNNTVSDMHFSEEHL